MSIPCVTLTEVRYPEHITLHLRTNFVPSNNTTPSLQQAQPTLRQSQFLTQTPPSVQQASSTGQDFSSAAQQVRQTPQSTTAIHSSAAISSVSDSLEQLVGELNASPLFLNYHHLIRVWHAQMVAKYLGDLESQQGRQTASVNIYMLIDQVINPALKQHVDNDDALLTIDDFRLKLEELLLPILPSDLTLETIPEYYHQLNKEYEDENVRISEVHARYDLLLQDLAALTELTTGRISEYFEAIKKMIQNLNKDRLNQSQAAYKKIQALNRQVKTLEREMAKKAESVAENGIALLRQKELLLQIYQDYSDLVKRA